MNGSRRAATVAGAINRMCLGIRDSNNYHNQCTSLAARDESARNFRADSGGNALQMGQFTHVIAPRLR